jgi:hypothetical protein
MAPSSISPELKIQKVSISKHRQIIVFWEYAGAILLLAMLRGNTTLNFKV